MRREVRVPLGTVVGYAGVATIVAVAAGLQRRAAVAAAAPRYEAARDAVLAAGRRERPGLESVRPDWLVAAPSPLQALPSLAATVLAVAATFAVISVLAGVLAASSRRAYAWVVAGAAASCVVAGTAPLSLVVPPLMTGDRHDPVGAWGDLLEPRMSVPLWWRVIMAGVTLGFLALVIRRSRGADPEDVRQGRGTTTARRRAVTAAAALGALCGAWLLGRAGLTHSGVLGAGPYGWEFFFSGAAWVDELSVLALVVVAPALAWFGHAAGPAGSFRIAP